MTRQPIAPFKIRLTPQLRERLEESAHRRKTSLNAEIVERLEASFRQEDVAGGRHMALLADLWRAGFRQGAFLGAQARDLDPGDMDRALRDQFVFRTAVAAGNDALLKSRPIHYEGDFTAAEIEQFNKMLDIMTRATARGEWLEEQEK